MIIYILLSWWEPTYNQGLMTFSSLKSYILILIGWKFKEATIYENIFVLTPRIGMALGWLA